MNRCRVSFVSISHYVTVSRLSLYQPASQSLPAAYLQPYYTISRRDIWYTSVSIQASAGTLRAMVHQCRYYTSVGIRHGSMVQQCKYSQGVMVHERVLTQQCTRYKGAPAMLYENEWLPVMRARGIVVNIFARKGVVNGNDCTRGCCRAWVHERARIQ